MFGGNEEYSKITEFTLKNFECIENGKVAFDEDGIIVLKGFNSSGKSSMMRALRVVFEDYNRTKQKMFISHGKDYFRLQLKFDDGVVITRDKYKNGQSLYLMEKNGVTLYTNKTGREFTAVKEMPEIMRNYLGIHKFQKRVINFQDCKEDFLLVDTSPSDNYKMLGKASDDGALPVSLERLKKEQGAIQKAIINVDKDIDKYDSLVESNNTSTPDIIAYLKDLDAKTDGILSAKQLMEDIQKAVNTINASSDITTEPYETHPELLAIHKYLNDIIKTLKIINKPVQDEYIKKENLMQEGYLLSNILSQVEKINNTEVFEAYPKAEFNAGYILNNLAITARELAKAEDRLQFLDDRVKTVRENIRRHQDDLAREGYVMSKCPNCGSYHLTNVVGD